MGSIPNLPGILSKMIETPRLNTHVLLRGAADGVPVLLIHGNASSNTFWEETMLALPAGFRTVAPDLRGYGDTEDRPVDATRGCMDWVDDLLGLMDVLGYARFHVAGHSLGGSVVWALLAAAPERVLTATVIAPGSPFGFGGTKDLQGTPCAPDFAGPRVCQADCPGVPGNRVPGLPPNRYEQLLLETPLPAPPRGGPAFGRSL